jgi:endonuclease YncB( thermonuclease family)
MAKRRETVIKVIDGDTIKTSCRKKSVRLANVDAPELGSVGGQRAAKALRDIIQGQKVKVNTVARDSYGRTVAKVTTEDGRSINNAMNRFLKKK